MHKSEKNATGEQASLISLEILTHACVSSHAVKVRMGADAANALVLVISDVILDHIIKCEECSKS